MDIEKILEILRCDDDKKVAYAAFMFKEEAEHWWRMEKEVKRYPTTPMTWEQFKTGFLERYFPQVEKDRLAQEFMNLAQGGMTVGEYEEKFTKLARHAMHMVADERHKARKFERGLKWSIKEKLIALELPTYQEVVRKARVLEGNEKERDRKREEKKRTSSRGDFRGGSHNFKKSRQCTSSSESFAPRSTGQQGVGQLEKC